MGELTRFVVLAPGVLAPCEDATLPARDPRRRNDEGAARVDEVSFVSAPSRRTLKLLCESSAAVLGRAVAPCWSTMAESVLRTN
jgi:hypothetical protein